MKKIFTIAIILVALITKAQVPSYVPTNGLVGYWPFNGNANDISGNGNNGIITGATLTSDRFGNNSCYNFNVNNWSWGTGGDEIYIPFNNAFNSENITVSAWFMKTSNGTLNQSLTIINRFQFGYNNPNGQTWQIALPNGDNSPLWTSVIEASNQNNQQSITAIGSKIALNTWYNVIFTFDGQELKQYINGVFIASNNLAGFKLNTNGNSGISIGVSDQANGHWSPFGGKIDDTGIWNRALTQQEITNLYNASLPQTACLPANVPTNGLVGYWPFCGNANDESGNGNNGTVNGATLTTDRFGGNNSAFNFDGVSNFIEIPSSSSLQVKSSYTISAWVFMDYQNYQSIDQHSIISKIADGDWYGGYELRINNLSNINTVGTFSTTGNIGGVNTALGSTNVVTGKWYLVTVTYNSSILKIYINNIEAGSTVVNGNIQTSNNRLRFGRRGEGNSFNCWYKGKIDDIGIWNRALSQEEITSLYNTNQCITNITVTDTLIINVGQLSFSEPVTWANNITIFPNPASTQININFNNITNLNGGTLKIINSLGQQVATTPITTSGTNSTMQLATWGGSGMYFVQIINSQGQIVDIKKIILQ